MKVEFDCFLLILFVFVLFVNGEKVANKYYTCDSDTKKCHLYKLSNQNMTIRTNDMMDQNTCLMICDNGNIWPYPNGVVNIKENFQFFEFDSKMNINFQWNFDVNNNRNDNNQINILSKTIQNNFIDIIKNMKIVSNVPINENEIENKNVNKGMLIFDIKINNIDIVIMDMKVDESYSVLINSVENSENIKVSLSANTIFGIRHGLETVSQLIAWDTFWNSYTIASDVSIQDKPQFPYRGVMVDLSRSFIKLDKLYAIINAMVYITT